jgi:EAL domain-containing protein (putative c-di-GMP-specific phosphodiesterase class I)
VRLAHDLGLRVTAEGIETADERCRLREMGCDYLQGYFLAPPPGAGRSAGIYPLGAAVASSWSIV